MRLSFSVQILEIAGQAG